MLDFFRRKTGITPKKGASHITSTSPDKSEKKKKKKKRKRATQREHSREQTLTAMDAATMLDAANEPPAAAAATPPATPAQSPAPSTMKTVKDKVADTAKEIKGNPRLIKEFIDSTFRKGVNGLVSEFKGMKRINNFAVMKEFVIQNAEQRNRYKDVGCLDNSRVVLQLGPVPYIHANYVRTESCEKRFICTQAPLQKTCQDFWYMILQEQSTTILMLCNVMELGHKKCEPYYATDVDGKMEFGPIAITTKKVEELKLQDEATKTKVIVSDLEVTLNGANAHKCQHYHWVDWPDRSVPDVDTFPVALLEHFKNVSTPIVVHCSAGIGRTGCIVLLEHALDHVKRGRPLPEMKDLLEKLRSQRNNSIQTEHQYLYVHQVLLTYFKATELMTGQYLELFETFTTNYNNTVK